MFTVHLIESSEGGNASLKGADMGKVTKTVMEDVAYQLKRVGLLCKAFNDGQMSEDTKVEYDAIDFTNTEDIVDWLASNIHEVFAGHDPTFDGRKFLEQAAFKVSEDFTL